MPLPRLKIPLELIVDNFIINFAAETHVDRSIDDPDQFIKSNINGTFNLLEQGYQFWKELSSSEKTSFRFLQISTDEVYGSAKTIKFDEKSIFNPQNPYSSTKASAEHLVKAWGNTYNIPYLIQYLYIFSPYFYKLKQ